MACGGFRQPTLAKCLSAIGLKQVDTRGSPSVAYEVLHAEVYPTKKVPAVLVSALYPDNSLFLRIPKPGPHDWLANHTESGQTFLQFTRSARNRPTRQQSTLYILPATFFENDVSGDVIADMAEFAASFFDGMPVKVMKPVAGLKKTVPSRVNDDTGQVQVHAGVVLEEMKKLVPRDAFCVGALTLCDIYPRESWNFVFGLASMSHRVGVYSLARLMPSFYKEDLEEKDSKALSKADRTDLLLSACRLMCHEMCHMFGLTHCVFYHCIMNGSNNYEESARRPLHLCPVCLRKLQLACGFRVVERYEGLLAWCRQKGLVKHAEWLTRRIQALQ